MKQSFQSCVAALIIMISFHGSAQSGHPGDDNSQDTTLTFVLIGSPVPPIDPNGNPVVNGDFIITRSGGDSLVGDGIDDETSWRFTFPQQTDPNIQVNSALLTIILTPKAAGESNDDLRIECSCGFVPVGTHPIGAQYDTTIELLGTFPPQLFVDSLLLSNGISMGYQDDAIISYVELHLVIASTVDVNEPPGGVPKGTTLAQNYPNPFNPSTAISYQLTAVSQVSLKIFNILGQSIATLVDGRQEAGYRRQEWNAAGVPSGVYFYRLEARSLTSSETFVSTRKMVVIK